MNNLNITTRRLIACIGVALAVVLVAFSVLVPAVAPVGVALAVGSVVGDLKETTTAEEHKIRDVSDALTYMDESYQVPLDQMLRRMPKRQKKAESIICEWTRVDRTPPRRDATSAAVAAGAAGEPVVVPVANASMWRPNDLVYIPNNATDPTLVLQVTAVGANTITVYALPKTTTKKQTAEAFGTVPALGEAETLVRFTTSKTENDTPSASRMTMPEYLWNYIHTFDAVVKASDHRQRTKNYTMQDWQRVRADNLVDFRRSIEYNFFFGQRSITTDPTNGEMRWTMGGLVNYIPTTLEYETANGITEANLTSLARQIFTGNTGSRERVWFCDAIQAERLDLIMLQKMQHTPSRTIAGIRCTQYDGRFGKLYIVHHPGFDELGKEDFGVVVDLRNIYKVVMQPTEKIKLRLKETGLGDADAEQYIEKSTVEVRNPDTHFLVVGV